MASASHLHVAVGSPTTASSTTATPVPTSVLRTPYAHMSRMPASTPVMMMADPDDDGDLQDEVSPPFYKSLGVVFVDLQGPYKNTRCDLCAFALAHPAPPLSGHSPLFGQTARWGVLHDVLTDTTLCREPVEEDQHAFHLHCLRSFVLARRDFFRSEHAGCPVCSGLLEDKAFQSMERAKVEAEMAAQRALDAAEKAAKQRANREDNTARKKWQVSIHILSVTGLIPPTKPKVRYDPRTYMPILPPKGTDTKSLDPFYDENSFHPIASVHCMDQIKHTVRNESFYPELKRNDPVINPTYIFNQNFDFEKTLSMKQMASESSEDKFLEIHIDDGVPRLGIKRQTWISVPNPKYKPGKEKKPAASPKASSPRSREGSPVPPAPGEEPPFIRVLLPDEHELGYVKIDLNEVYKNAPKVHETYLQVFPILAPCNHQRKKGFQGEITLSITVLNEDDLNGNMNMESSNPVPAVSSPAVGVRFAGIADDDDLASSSALAPKETPIQLPLHLYDMEVHKFTELFTRLSTQAINFSQECRTAIADARGAFNKQYVHKLVKENVLEYDVIPHVTQELTSDSECIYQVYHVMSKSTLVDFCTIKGLKISNLKNIFVEVGYKKEELPELKKPKVNLQGGYRDNLVLIYGRTEEEKEIIRRDDGITTVKKLPKHTDNCTRIRDLLELGPEKGETVARDRVEGRVPGATLLIQPRKEDRLLEKDSLVLVRLDESEIARRKEAAEAEARLKELTTPTTFAAQQYDLVQVRVYQADDLPKMRELNWTNASVALKYKGFPKELKGELKSSLVLGSNSPAWNTEFSFCIPHCALPADQSFELIVRDEEVPDDSNGYAADREWIGSVDINFSDVLSLPANAPPIWKNLYADNRPSDAALEAELRGDEEEIDDTYDEETSASGKESSKSGSTRGMSAKELEKSRKDKEKERSRKAKELHKAQEKEKAELEKERKRDEADRIREEKQRQKELAKVAAEKKKAEEDAEEEKQAELDRLQEEKEGLMSPEDRKVERARVKAEKAAAAERKKAAQAAEKQRLSEENELKKLKEKKEKEEAAVKAKVEKEAKALKEKKEKEESALKSKHEKEEASVRAKKEKEESKIAVEKLKREKAAQKEKEKSEKEAEKSRLASEKSSAAGDKSKTAAATEKESSKTSALKSKTKLSAKERKEQEEAEKEKEKENEEADAGEKALTPFSPYAAPSAPLYRGRILCEFIVTRGVRKFLPPKVDLIDAISEAKKPPSGSYQLDVELYDATNLPGNADEYQLDISLGHTLTGKSQEGGKTHTQVISDKNRSKSAAQRMQQLEEAEDGSILPASTTPFSERGRKVCFLKRITMMMHELPYPAVKSSSAAAAASVQQQQSEREALAPNAHLSPTGALKPQADTSGCSAGFLGDAALLANASQTSTFDSHTLNLSHQSQFPDLIFTLTRKGADAKDPKEILGYIRIPMDEKKKATRLHPHGETYTVFPSLWDARNNAIRTLPFTPVNKPWMKGSIGNIMMKISITDVFGPSIMHVAYQIQQEEIRPAPKQMFKLLTHVYQAKEVAAIENSQFASPVAIVGLAGGHPQQIAQTKPKLCTAYPQWFECFESVVELPQNLNHAADIYVNVFHSVAPASSVISPKSPQLAPLPAKVTVDMSNLKHFLGRAEVPMRYVQRKGQGDRLSDPAWFPLKFEEHQLGNVLLSFQLTALEEGEANALLASATASTPASAPSPVSPSSPSSPSSAVSSSPASSLTPFSLSLESLIKRWPMYVLELTNLDLRGIVSSFVGTRMIDPIFELECWGLTQRFRQSEIVQSDSKMTVLIRKPPSPAFYSSLQIRVLHDKTLLACTSVSIDQLLGSCSRWHKAVEILTREEAFVARRVLRRLRALVAKKHQTLRGKGKSKTAATTGGGKSSKTVSKVVSPVAPSTAASGTPTKKKEEPTPAQKTPSTSKSEQHYFEPSSAALKQQETDAKAAAAAAEYEMDSDDEREEKAAAAARQAALVAGRWKSTSSDDQSDKARDHSTSEPAVLEDEEDELFHVEYSDSEKKKLKLEAQKKTSRSASKHEEKEQEEEKHNIRTTTSISTRPVSVHAPTYKVAKPSPGSSNVPVEASSLPEPPKQKVYLKFEEALAQAMRPRKLDERGEEVFDEALLHYLQTDQLPGEDPGNYFLNHWRVACEWEMLPLVQGKALSNFPLYACNIHLNGSTLKSATDGVFVSSVTPVGSIRGRFFIYKQGARPDLSMLVSPRPMSCAPKPQLLQLLKGKSDGKEQIPDSDPLFSSSSYFQSPPISYAVRVYVLRAMNLTRRQGKQDSCDPFVRLKIAGHPTILQSNIKNGTIHPEYYECFEFTDVTLPRDDAQLIAEVRNDNSCPRGPSQENDVPGLVRSSRGNMVATQASELIGFTTIDLENRVYNNLWRNNEPGPIERRALKKSRSAISMQGSIEMVIQILPMGDFRRQRVPRPLDYLLKPPPRHSWEMRVTFWRCRNVQQHEFPSNLRLIAGLSGSALAKAQAGDRGSTAAIHVSDMHSGCTDGNPAFNFRLVLPFEMPRSGPISSLKVQIWSVKDVVQDSSAPVKKGETPSSSKHNPTSFTQGRCLGEAIVPLWGVLELLRKQHDLDPSNRAFQVKRVAAQWLPFIKPDGEMDPNTKSRAKAGEFEMSLEILSKDLAQSKDYKAAGGKFAFDPRYNAPNQVLSEPDRTVDDLWEVKRKAKEVVSYFTCRA